MGLNTRDCEACADLLTVWQLAVSIYTDFVLEDRRVLADDVRLTAKEGERLRVNCSAARDAFMEHRQEHARDDYQRGLAASTKPMRCSCPQTNREAIGQIGSDIHT
jgi:hypothetical protein